MLFLVLLTIFEHTLPGSSYVVLRNNYYFPWQHHSVRGLPLIYSPVQYPFHNWMYYTKQETLELKYLKERQTTTFNLLKCLIEEKQKSVCKTMLDNAKKLFESPESPQIDNVVIKYKPSQTATVSTNQNGYKGPPTIVQPYPPATESIQTQNKNQENEDNNTTVLETRNKEEIAAPLSITPVSVDAKIFQFITEETNSKKEDSLSDVKTTEMPSDESLITDAILPSDGDVIIQTPGEVLSNTSNSDLDKTEETSETTKKEQPTTTEKVI